MISIIVPTYKERDNIKKLIPMICKTLHDYEHEVIIVDDSSPDGTAKIAEKLAERYSLKVLKRARKFGLASAILHGFNHANGDILGVIDADLQHPPEYMKEFIKAIENGYDIALGSRYVKGGRIEGWSKKRILISKGAILLAKPLIWRVKDPISGYFFFRRGVIESVKFNPTGYKLSLELLVKGNYSKIKEIPYTFKVRGKGESKLNSGEIYRYLHLIGHLYKYQILRILRRLKSR
jgi:dolichol-phosphate mannosyltransferase